ncbi:aminopeptidase [Shouchella lehensis]|uniref:aminopeptidase n=1 Tax=Shouchella lehensis TaxID=300825 RepID=UPI0034632E14
MQKNQLVIIHSDIENVTFARLIQKAAYGAGASNVIIDWTDEQSTKEFYLHAAEDAIDYFPNWQSARSEEWDKAGAAYIHIISENINLFSGISPKRVDRFQTTSRTKLKAHYAKVRSHEVRWCILAVPCFSWASQVFPYLSKEEAMKSLWQLILKGARADGENPIDDWKIHDRAFEARKKFLNDSQFEALHFTNSRGTDLLVGMPKKHLYIGGGVLDKKGVQFFPNIPTEEIFSAPHKSKVKGTLVATKPDQTGGKNTIILILMGFTEK